MAAQSNSTSTIDTIVVPLDGSSVASRVLPIVKRLAAMHGAQVLLATSTWNGQGATAAELSRAASELTGVSCHTVFVDDRPPADAAIDLVLAGDRRVICMSSHGRGGLGRTVLGSVASGIIHGGIAPIIVVGPSCEPDALERPGPIVLCTDGSRRSRAVVESGRDWARSLDRNLRLVLVTHPMDPTTGPESADLFDELLAPLGLEAPEASGICVANSSVPVGLVMEAQRLKSPLMVIEPAVRSRLGQLVLGSTTLAIIGDAPCPVLVLPKDHSGVEAP